MRLPLCAGVLFGTLGLLTVSAEAKPIVEVRSAGTNLVRKIDLASLPRSELRKNDQQYKREYLFQGVTIGSVLLKAGVTKGFDLALLHFKNGIVVPVAAAKVRNLFIALALSANKGKPAWSTDFPKIRRKHPYFADRNPIAPSSNKVVVDNLEHPMVPARARKKFSPWMYADSLIKIELVNRRAYYAQFAFSKDAKVLAGLRAFKQSCQFCHGLKGVGARYGYAFDQLAARWARLPPDQVPMSNVDPIRRSSSRSLFHHVRRAVPDALDRGLRMPPLPFLTKAELISVWHFLRASAKTAIKPYRP